MSEVLIPKMKRVSHSKKSFKIPWLNLAIIVLCVCLIIGANFLNVNLKHFIVPSKIFSANKLSFDDFVFSFYYIPQVPVVMFVSSFLNKKMALFPVILYILLGLFFIPIFALGGGIKYIAQFGFGYILGFIPATIVSTNILSVKYSFPNMIKSAVFGVFIIHIIGILYMILIALFNHSGIDFIQSWIISQSGLKLIYDLILSFVLILIGKYCNSALKFIIE